MLILLTFATFSTALFSFEVSLSLRAVYLSVCATNRKKGRSQTAKLRVEQPRWRGDMAKRERELEKPGRQQGGERDL